MRQTQLFTKTRKEAPADETSKNAKLLIRAGFVHKELAGVYSLLPLGLRVINKIEKIIRSEMNEVGGVEMKTSILQKKEIWEKTGRWDDSVVDGWFKTKLKNGGELGLSFTNEEAYADLLKQYVSSYNDLPIYAYDFKEIFRNETRSKSGILRGREFYWKALYSFCRDEAEHNIFYEKMKTAYRNIFNMVGIGDLTYITFSSGGTFSKFSHEFQALTEAGEDIIFINKDDYGKGCSMEDDHAAINKEIWNDDLKKDLGLNGEQESSFIEKKSIEVGNIFTLGFKFSEPLDLNYKDKDGKEHPVFMGCYGIGLGRLLGTIVEILSDDKGLVWPRSVAPFTVHLVRISDSTETITFADELYLDLQKSGIEVLYDDRPDVRAGEKFADSDLIGLPVRLVISDKTVAAGKIEVKGRKENEAKMIERSEILNFLNNTKNTL